MKSITSGKMHHRVAIWVSGSLSQEFNNRNEDINLFQVFFWGGGFLFIFLFYIFLFLFFLKKERKFAHRNVSPGL